MANGFKLIGGGYVAKWGNNSPNTGTSDAQPRLTISSGMAITPSGQNCIVLAGVYREALTVNRNLIGDGIVKIIGNSANTFGISGGGLTNFEISDFAQFNEGGGYQLNNCKLKNIPIYTGLFFQQNNNVFINIGTTANPAGSGATGYYCQNSLFFNCVLNAFICTSNYIDSSVEIIGISLPITYTNFRGKFTRTGVTLPGVYCVPTGADITISGGTATVVSFASRTGSYPSGCTDWLHVGLGQTATQCYVTNGNFNADPQFVDMFNEDFSVLPTSPMIGKGTGGTNIGNVKVTNTSLRKTATQFASKTNLSGTTDLSVEPSNITGEWISEVITIDALNPRVFQRPTYVGNLSFEAGQTGNTANVNDNVPWIPTYVKNGVTINNQTNKQLRPCVLVRFSNKNSMPSPTVDSDWDNGNNNTTTVNGVLPGEYFLAELNADFKYDGNGFGNADVNFNPVVNSQIAAKYCMYKVILTDNYPNV